MTMDQSARPALPRTLAAAHEVVAAMRPHREAPLSEWLVFHQRSAAMYAEVAEIDRGHHHESLFMAEHERQLAKDIKAAMSSAGESEGERG